jgi:hypothetical protein
MVRLLVGEHALNSEAKIHLHVHGRGGAPVLCQAQIRVSFSSSEGCFTMGTKLTPVPEVASSHLKRAAPTATRVAPEPAQWRHAAKRRLVPSSRYAPEWFSTPASESSRSTRTTEGLNRGASSSASSSGYSSDGSDRSEPIDHGHGEEDARSGLDLGASVAGLADLEAPMAGLTMPTVVNPFECPDAFVSDFLESGGVGAFGGDEADAGLDFLSSLLFA